MLKTGGADCMDCLAQSTTAIVTVTEVANVAIMNL